MRKMEVLSPVLFAIYVDDVARCCKNERYLHIILYADDILLLAPSVTQLEKLLLQEMRRRTQLTWYGY